MNFRRKQAQLPRDFHRSPLHRDQLDRITRAITELGRKVSGSKLHVHISGTQRPRNMYKTEYKTLHADLPSYQGAIISHHLIRKTD